MRKSLRRKIFVPGRTKKAGKPAKSPTAWRKKTPVLPKSDDQFMRDCGLGDWKQ